MPEKVTTLSGSCVTVPCSFTLADQYKDKLTSECEPIWVRNEVQFSSAELKGNLTKYNCTTTFNDVQVDGVEYKFRMECIDQTPAFIYTFQVNPVTIQIKGKCNVCLSETNMYHKSYWSYSGSNDAECW